MAGKWRNKVTCPLDLTLKKDSWFEASPPSCLAHYRVGVPPLFLATSPLHQNNLFLLLSYSELRRSLRTCSAWPKKAGRPPYHLTSSYLTSRTANPPITTYLSISLILVAGNYAKFKLLEICQLFRETYWTRFREVLTCRMLLDSVFGCRTSIFNGGNWKCTVFISAVCIPTFIFPDLFI